MKPLGSALLIAVAFACAPASAQNVKITPLGSHTGELCDRDRATIFEDPTGERILYDAGHSVTGASGPGSVSARRAAESCAWRSHGGSQVEGPGGKPTGACGQTGSDLVVPLPAACLVGVHLGGVRAVKSAVAARVVEITVVYAAHDSTVSRNLLTEKKDLEPDNVSLSLGPPTGYVVQFTNGLKVYLSGDTGLHSEMQAIVNEFHKVNLAMFNLGPSAVTSASAAYAINEYIRPASVIATHVNEGATVDGKVRPGSRTAAFMALVKGRPVYLALRGKTMGFDGNAKCVAGC